MNGKKWILASISSLGLLLLVGGVWWGLSYYYHPLTLIHVVDRQNVIGYVEWRKQDQSQLLAGDGVPLPQLLHELHCTSLECPYSGESNALVLRKINNEPLWEYYVANPNRTILQANWESLTKGKNELTVDQERYRLYWNNDIAIFSPRTNATSALTFVAQMPWTSDKSWSVWGRFLAAGYCDSECLWYNWQKVGDQFPLLTDFVADTVDYGTFVIKSSPSGPKFNYQLNYTASYHPSNSTKQVIKSVHIPLSAQLIFSGESLSATITDLLHDTQNKGLWKTIVDFGSETPTGMLLEAISKITSMYPYTVIIDKNWQSTTVQLSITESEWSVMQNNMVDQAKLIIPTLFPRKEALVLPDSSVGYEWVKNNNLQYIWSGTPQNKSELTISDMRNGSIVAKLYASFANDVVTLAMQPINSSATQTCTFEQPYQEFSAWHQDNQTWLWSGVTQRSLGSERGVIGWQKSIPNCVQN